jgi:hypothetical protein
VRVLGILKDYYGVVEKTDSGYWRLTDVGKRAGRGDPMALKEVFSKNEMFSDLYSEFGDKDVMPSVMLDYIKKNYRGTDAEEVKGRLLEGIKIIKDHPAQSHEQANQEVSQDFTLPIFQLRYALRPPSDAEIDHLVGKVVENLSKSDDDVLKFISKLMIKKETDRKELANLLDEAMDRLDLNGHKGEETKSDSPKSGQK